MVRPGEVQFIYRGPAFPGRDHFDALEDETALVLNTYAFRLSDHRFFTGSKDIAAASPILTPLYLHV
jgi:hypothetical protein